LVQTIHKLTVHVPYIGAAHAPQLVDVEVSVAALQRIVGPSNCIQSLGHNGLALRQLELTADSAVLVGREHTHHVRVVTVRSMMTGQKTEDETNRIALWIEGTQQHSTLRSNCFQQVCRDDLQVTFGHPDLVLEGFNLREAGQVCDRPDGDSRGHCADLCRVQSLS